MKTHLILTEYWKEMTDAIPVAQKYLSIFGVHITYERKEADVSSEFLYETTKSWGGLIQSETKSLKPSYIFGLSSDTTADCIGIICDKEKAIERTNLFGQQATLGNKQIIEVYAVKKRSGTYGFTPIAYTLIHELLHALADFHKVEDTLHKYLTKNKTSLDSYRSELVGKIYKTEFGLLPVVDQKAKQLIEYAKQIGTPIRITEGYRSPERQNELYKQKPKVTNAKAWESIHQYRCAFDIVFIKEGYNATSTQWNMLGAKGKELGFDWGGSWTSFVDKPHFELVYGKTCKDFQKNDIDWSMYLTNTPVEGKIKPKFDRDLTIGSRGEDVLILQKAMNKLGYFVAKTGAGSSGKETDYFGILTQKAVMRFQQKNIIFPSKGYFGKKTKDVLIKQLELC